VVVAEQAPDKTDTLLDHFQEQAETDIVGL
jgi:hypothetical protein